MKRKLLGLCLLLLSLPALTGCHYHRHCGKTTWTMCVPIAHCHR